ncbi:MAG: hypothetical protein UT33_C0005G0142 [Candidatus Peregrinibacteria bacterium GW2011_GWC2_39_14]|nr:MAG: hypothetical protein US92_C0001G0143 [Candidatus Peregrinibacteria bacterium GW2011_GWA2_38_36]KKR07198.1 MAG: hypothetical protein UT33_C0005G0142 [Candidatus Peregrinibacteria bacterium GW2011_GWC2_39_14]
MVLFVFTKYAENVFKKLPKIERERILSKLIELKKHQDIFSILRKLIDFEPATHRLRIGDYRLILELKKYDSKIVELWVLDVGHRKDIYN